MIKVTLIGHVGRDPEVRYLPNGNTSVSFSVASNRRMKNESGGAEQATEWFSVFAYGKLADYCNEYIQKGSHVYIDGRLSSNSYTGKDNKLHFSMNIQLSQIELVGNNKHTEFQNSQQEIDHDDLPF